MYRPFHCGWTILHVFFLIIEPGDKMVSITSSKKMFFTFEKSCPSLWFSNHNWKGELWHALLSPWWFHASFKHWRLCWICGVKHLCSAFRSISWSGLSNSWASNWMNIVENIFIHISPKAQETMKYSLDYFVFLAVHIIQRLAGWKSCTTSLWVMADWHLCGDSWDKRTVNTVIREVRAGF